MRGALDFLWLLIRCIVFLWVMTTLLILVLFVVGTEAEGLTLPERLITAVTYGGYMAGIFGTLLAFYLAFKTWRVERSNKKKLARREKT